MKVFIIYHRVFDFSGKELSIGGIQTYILNLSKMLLDNGFTPIIYQLADEAWQIKHNGIEIRGITKLSTQNTLKQSEHILHEIKKEYKKDDLVIWANDNIAVSDPTMETLLIQHGIGFDYIPKDSKITKLLQRIPFNPLKTLLIFYKYLQRRRSVESFVKAKYKICVDYNYLNWIRTMLPREELKHIHVIPNFTHINDQININLKSQNDTIYILFARRFTEERGVLILIDIIDQLSVKYSNLHFTIAGEGPYSPLLEKKYSDFPNITITKYNHEDSLKNHLKHHISIIPTYGSEGTSLSLLEAMTSGCAPIASNVGGMTNIILDGYNGYLIEPSAKAFIEKLSLLIENEQTRKMISINAKETADSAFSYAIWEEKWLHFLKHEIGKNK